MKWYKIASQRVNSLWWDAVLAPLRELESGATGGMAHLEKPHADASNEHENVIASGLSDLPMPNELPRNVDLPKESGRKNDVESSGRNSFAATRNTIEDMELQTRALTEPLPTNQQVYWYQLNDLKGFFANSCFIEPFSLCRHTKIICYMQLKNGLQSVKYFILRVLFWDFVLDTLFILVLVYRHSEQKRDGCVKGCKLK